MAIERGQIKGTRYAMPSCKDTGEATLDITRGSFTSFLAITVGGRTTNLEFKSDDLDTALKILGYERPPF